MKMFPPIILFALFVCKTVFVESKLNWKTHKIKNSKNTSFIATHAEFKSGKNHTLHVVRFQKGHPSAHIFLLAPSAGQGSVYWEEKLNDLENIYDRDFVLYAVDLRGCSKASPFSSNSSTSWKSSDMGEFRSEDGELKVSDMTISKLASDLISIIGKVRKEPGFSGTVHVHSRAFGALIAMEMDKEGIESFLFESPLTVENYFKPNNDFSFLNTCKNDSFCSSRYPSKDLLQVRNQLLSLGTSGYNKCSIEMMKQLRELTTLMKSESDWLVINEFLSPFMNGQIETGKHHSSMLTLPFIQNAFLCKDLDFFKTSVLEPTIALYKKYPRTLHKVFDGGKDVNRFSNALFMSQDVFSIGNEKKHFCDSAVPLGLASPCIYYHHYLKYKKTFMDHIKKRSGNFNKIECIKSNLFFITSSLDLQTTPEMTKQFSDNSKGKSKRFITFTNLGHNPIANSGTCASLIGKEVLGKGSFKETDSCVESLNKAKLDWEFKNFTVGNLKPSRWWTASINQSPIVKNRAGLSNWAYIIILTSVIVAIILSVGSIAYFLGFRFSRKNCKTSALPK